MAAQDKGWDFLNSKDCGFLNEDEEGGDSYRYSDGSGYYHGADGSEDYIYSDGSGYYHGADGSDGYKYSDGTGYYKNSDGDTSYFDSNEDGYDDDETDEPDDSSWGELIGSLIGLGVAGAMAARTRAAEAEREREAQREAERREKERIRKDKRKAWNRKYKKGICISILMVIMGIIIMIGYYEFQKLIPMGYSSEYLIGNKYTDVVQLLKESGFSYVKTKEISDLTLSREDEEYLVTEIKLLYGNTFDEDTKYPSNLGVTVVYHTVELYAPPLSAKEAKGMNYLDVIEEFENAGFVNVTTNIKYDIITGWLKDDGEVSSVTINGEKKFDSYDEFRLDSEVVITYHTLKKNKPK